MAELYDRYSSIVYAVALRVLGDTGAANILQDVFCSYGGILRRLIPREAAWGRGSP